MKPRLLGYGEKEKTDSFPPQTLFQQRIKLALLLSLIFGIQLAGFCFDLVRMVKILPLFFRTRRNRSGLR